MFTDLQKQFESEKIRILRVKVNKEKSKGEIKLEMDLLYPAKFDRTQMVDQWSKDERVQGISG